VQLEPVTSPVQEVLPLPGVVSNRHPLTHETADGAESRSLSQARLRGVRSFGQRQQRLGLLDDGGQVTVVARFG
jgi:hypothetical protein